MKSSPTMAITCTKNGGIGANQAATSSRGELAGTSKGFAAGLSWKKFMPGLADSSERHRTQGLECP